MPPEVADAVGGAVTFEGIDYPGDVWTLGATVLRVCVPRRVLTTRKLYAPLEKLNPREMVRIPPPPTPPAPLVRADGL
jgi:hypothetical protein